MQFNTIIDFGKWLTNQDQKLQATLCIRSMLRGLPAITMVDDEAIILKVFRGALTTLNGLKTNIEFNNSADKFMIDQEITPRAAQYVSLACWESARVVYGPSQYENITICIEDGANSIIFLEKSPELRHTIERRLLDELINDLEIYTKHGQETLLTSPLWDRRVGSIPSHISSETVTFLHTDKYQKHDWEFWRVWYLDMLVGKTLDQNLHSEISSIPDDDWELGISHIANLIDEIKARSILARLPLAEDIGFDEQESVYFVTPTGITNPNLLSTNIQLLSDVLEDAIKGNGLTVNSWEYRTLQKTLINYSNDPERIEMDCVRVHQILHVKVGSELPESEELIDLTSTLLNVAVDIRANHPEIAHNRANRALQIIRESNEGEKDQLRAALPQIRAITTDDLGQQLENDIHEIIDESNDDQIVKHEKQLEPVIRTGNRLIKIWQNLSRKVKNGIVGTFTLAGVVVTLYEAAQIIKILWLAIAKLIGM